MSHKLSFFIFLFFLREMCVRFADLERKLGEIDRARAVYMHASQMADPRVCFFYCVHFLKHSLFPERDWEQAQTMRVIVPLEAIIRVVTLEGEHCVTTLSLVLFSSVLWADTTYFSDELTQMEQYFHRNIAAGQVFKFFSRLQTTPTFWKVWHDFEVRHGNEDTFREMLRIKRSVQAQFNTQVSGS